MSIRVPLYHTLILTGLIILPIIAFAQWEYETVTTGGYKNAIAVDSNGNPHISYSDNTIGHHLKYAHWNGAEWQLAVVEPTSVRGVKSIAIDASQNPHIAFKKIRDTGEQLWHAWWDGSIWQQAGVDSLEGVVGYWNSIAIASDGYPHIAYSVTMNDWTKYYLKYTYQDASGWHSSVIDSLSDSWFRHISMALDTSNRPHISYQDPYPTPRMLKYAYWNGSIWQIDTVDAENYNQGEYTSIATDSLGYPHIAYSSYSQGLIKYASWDGSSWTIENIELTRNKFGSSSLALDANDSPHISHTGGNDGLLYTYWDGSSWQTEEIDESNCDWTSLAIDDSGASHISYYDGVQQVLKYASKHPIPVDVTPPAAPQSLIATPGDGEVSLVWRMNMEVDVVSYRIYSGTSANPTTLTDSTTIRSDTTETISGLSINTKYYFRVTAMDDAGNESEYSNQDSATTLGSQSWHVSTSGSDQTGDGSQGNPFASIQYAINSAYNGDTVLVQPGTYVENINYNGKNIVLGSLFLTTLDTSYISQTVIDGDSSSSVVTFENGEDSTAVLNGFTITNGYAMFGGGIFCVSSSSPVLVNLVVGENTVQSDGGGIACRFNSNPKMENVTVSRNTAPNSAGGGIYLEGSSSPRLTDVTVSGNTAGNQGGGGIMCVDWANPTLVNVSVIGNISTSIGGGIYCLNYGNPTLTNVTVSGNTAESSGGGFYIDNSSPTLTDVTVSGNTAGSNGGGIACENWSSPSLVNVTIEDNSATDGEGGGIYLHYSSPTLTDVTVSGNTAGSNGGGITCADQSSPNLENVIIIENTATSSGGGINGWYFSNPNLTNVEIHSNSATNGGGIAFWDSCSLTLENVQFRWNTATNDGGGFYIRDSNPTLKNVEVIENWATNTGGGFYLYNSNLISDGIFVERNSAPYGGGLYTYGDCASSNMTIVTNMSENGFGGIYATNGTLTISNSNIAYNGIGLYNADNANFTNAINNWWGHSTGPYHPNFNTLGEGDSTNPFVYVTPWLTTPDIIAPPVPPQNLTVTSTGEDFISLSWDSSPLGDFDRFILHYRILGSGVNFPDIDVGADTSYSITGLPINTAYHIDLTLYDTDGNGSWFSNGVVASTIINAPGEFTLIFPDSDAEITTLSPTFRWNPAIDPDLIDTVRYRIFYGTTISDLTNIDVDTSTSWQVSTDLIDNSTYYWKVIATDLSGATTENTGGYWSFRVNTVNDLPGDFALLNPENGSMVTDLTPTFHWEEPTDPDDGRSNAGLNDLVTNSRSITRTNSRSITRYHVFISIDSLFNEVSPDTVITNSYTPSTDLNEDMVYYWKVEAVDNDGGVTGSAMWSFWTNSQNSIPFNFSVISPVNGINVDTITPMFTWHPSTDDDLNDMVVYNIYLGESIEDIESVYTGFVPWITDTTFTLIEPVADNTTYYWYVLATDLSGATAMNIEGFQSFNVNLGNEPPSVVELISPDSVVVLTLIPEFHWTEAIDPDPDDSVHYELHWVKDGDDFVDSALTDSNYAVPYAPLDDNSKFYWWVISMDRQYDLSESGEAVFWTDLYPEPPLAFSTVSPIDSTEGLPTEVEFIWNKAKDPDPIDNVSYTLVLFTEWGDSNSFDFIPVYDDTTVTVILSNDTEYLWMVEAMDEDEQVTLSNNGAVNRIVVGTLSIEDDLIPIEFALQQNYPNPFNPITTIRYDLPEHSFVTITIYDLLGKKVTTLVSETQEDGFKSVIWDATNDHGKPVSAGVYLYQIQAGEFIQTKKMVLLK